MNKPLQYENEFIRHKGSLESFIFRFVCNRQDMEDIVQETYIRVVENIDSFQNRSSFKTWIFTIASNIAKNHLKKQHLWKEYYQDRAEALHLKSDELLQKLINSHYSAPDIQFEIREHINYCFNCIVKTLNLSQQICLLLKEIYEFKIKEIMQITGFSEGKVKHNLSYARKKMIDIFNNRCALINKKGICSQCSSMMEVLHPEQNPVKKNRDVNLFMTDNNNNEADLLGLRMDLAKKIHPLKASNASLHIYLIEHLQEWAEIKN
jgi:RNA polymerase sigma-70 factor, ECF subfamily